MWEHTRGKTLTDRGRQQESVERDEQEDVFEDGPDGSGQATLDRWSR